MKVFMLMDILKRIPGNAEFYFLDSKREPLGLKCVEAEYPSDDEGEVCINFVLETDEE